MNIVIQKFGGTSVSSEEGRLHCIKHIEREIEKNNKVVVVVSAMGRKGDPYSTDTLLSLLDLKDSKLNDRELDLFMATGELISATVFSNLLFKKEIQNTVMTGGQAGIVTNDSFNDAKIISLQPQKILDALETNQVVVVTGFQGMTPNGDITTLGRGGSDTSATALGVSLNAQVVDIFTDVEGIFTADPRIVNDAQPLPTITYNEICNLAHLGAKVIHPRAVEIAMQKNIPVRVRCTFSEHEGTLITNISEMEKDSGSVNDRLITGITQSTQISQLIITNPTNLSEYPLSIFKCMKDSNISVDLINVTLDKTTYTVPKKDRELAVTVLTKLGYEVEFEDDFSKVSLVGASMSGVPGVMSEILEALHTHSIPVYQSADSHTTIWLLIKEVDMVKAVCALHKHFNLHVSF